MCSPIDIELARELAIQRLNQQMVSPDWDKRDRFELDPELREVIEQKMVMGDER